MSTTTVPDPAEGWTVPGYVEQRELSHGASGRVVEAVQDQTTLQVAIRYLSPELLEDPGFLRRFRTQMLKLKELDVPSVVRVYDYAEQPGQPGEPGETEQSAETEETEETAETEQSAETEEPQQTGQSEETKQPGQSEESGEAE
jgi:serine/threonine protein kinase